MGEFQMLRCLSNNSYIGTSVSLRISLETGFVMETSHSLIIITTFCLSLFKDFYVTMFALPAQPKNRSKNGPIRFALFFFLTQKLRG